MSSPEMGNQRNLIVWPHPSVHSDPKYPCLIPKIELILEEDIDYSLILG